VAADRILITGAGGFLGRYVVAQLPTACGITRAECDLTDLAAVRRTCDQIQPTLVIHLAAKIPGRGTDSLETIFRENVLATANLLSCLPATGYFLYSSTLDVYGDSPPTPITERTPTDPVTDYAIMKLAAEKVTQARAPARAGILRFTHLYGAGDHGIKLIPKVMETVARGDTPVIFGDGSDLRDFLHVTDAARAVVLAAQTRATGIFNVASGHSLTVRETVEAIFHAFQKPVAPIFKPRQKPRLDFSFDTSRLRSELQFQPQITFAVGLTALCETVNGELS